MTGLLPYCWIPRKSVKNSFRKAYYRIISKHNYSLNLSFAHSSSASAIVVRADLFLNRPECVGSAWAVHIPVENVLGEVVIYSHNQSKSFLQLLQR